MLTETHEHHWTGWWPSMLSNAAAVARESRQCVTCYLVEDRPVRALPEAPVAGVVSESAIEAAARAIRLEVLGGKVAIAVTTWHDYIPEAKLALAAAVPHIERAIRDKVAAEIRDIAETEHYDGDTDNALRGYDELYDVADRVARGGEATE